MLLSQKKNSKKVQLLAVRLQEVVLNRKIAKNGQKSMICLTPQPILELDGAINVSFGFWGVLGYVFDLTEWFGHIICGYDEKRVSKKKKTKLLGNPYQNNYWAILTKIITG